jgi:hypothetical protein
VPRDVESIAIVWQIPACATDDTPRTIMRCHTRRDRTITFDNLEVEWEVTQLWRNPMYNRDPTVAALTLS